MIELTSDRLRFLLSYDAMTGDFVWIHKPHRRANRVRVGAIAGQKDPSGYIRIQIDGQAYWAHRLAWLYVYEEWPHGVIDHKDGRRAHNAIANLRDTSIADNVANQKQAHRDSATGVLGVHKRKDTGRFSAYITVHKRRTSLGCFSSLSEASDVYQSARNDMRPV